jgi:hypothetical protein
MRLVLPIGDATGGSGNLSTSLSNVARVAAHPKFVWVFSANYDGTIIYNDPVFNCNCFLTLLFVIVLPVFLFLLCLFLPSLHVNLFLINYFSWHIYLSISLNISFHFYFFPFIFFHFLSVPHYHRLRLLLLFYYFYHQLLISFPYSFLYSANSPILMLHQFIIPLSQLVFLINSNFTISRYHLYLLLFTILFVI